MGSHSHILLAADETTDYVPYCFSRLPSMLKAGFTIGGNSSNPLGCLMFNFYAVLPPNVSRKVSNISQIIFSRNFTIVVFFYTHIMSRYVHIMFRGALWRTGKVFINRTGVDQMALRMCTYVSTIDSTFRQQAFKSI